MRLEITNFRCHEHYVLRWEEGEVVLLSGPSGRGKTTILEALSWLLYGKLLLIAPFSDEKKIKTSVSLTTESFHLFRSSNPTSLLWESEDETLEGQEAQDRIVDLFGPRNVWEACCYSVQGEKNPLFSGSQKEKIELLSYFAFSSDDPSAYISQIQSTLSETKSAAEKQISLCEEAERRFGEKWKEVPPKGGRRITEERKALQEEISSLSQELEAGEKLLAVHLRQEGVWKHLQEELSTLPLSRDLSVIQKEREREEEKKKHYQEWLAVSQTPSVPLLSREERKKYREEYNLWKMISDKTVTEERVREAEAYEKKARKKKELPKKPSQSLEELEEEQELWQRKQALLPRWKVLSSCVFREGVPLLSSEEKALYITNWRLAQGTKVRSSEEAEERKILLQKALQASAQKKPRSPYPSVPLSELPSLKKEYEEKKGGHDVLLCPHCSGSVRIMRGKLTSTEEKPCSAEELQNLKSLIASLEEWEGVDRELLLFKLPPGNPKQWEKELELLEKEVWKYAEFTPEELEGAEKKEEYEALLPLMTSTTKDRSKDIEAWKKILLLEEEIASLPDGVEGHLPSLRSDLNFLSRLTIREFPFLPDDLDAFAQKDSLKDLFADGYDGKKLPELIKEERDAKRREEISRQLSSIVLDHEFPSRLEALRKKKEKKEEELRNALRYREYLSDKQALKKIMRETEEKEESLAAAETLLAAAKEVESHVLSTTVDSFNTLCQDILDLLFSRELSAELSLFRTAKTTGNTKATVNLQIWNKGCHYDSANQLSGGELARLSLAVTLALSAMNSFPILLLDESLANLDQESRELCLKAIRNYRGEKSVLCVLHTAVEGHFDQVVEM